MIFLIYDNRQEQISPMWRRHWALFGQDPISADPSLPMFAEARMHESTLWVESFLRWILLGEFSFEEEPGVFHVKNMFFFWSWKYL